MQANVHRNEFQEILQQFWATKWWMEIDTCMLVNQWAVRVGHGQIQGGKKCLYIYVV